MLSEFHFYYVSENKKRFKCKGVFKNTLYLISFYNWLIAYMLKQMLINRLHASCTEKEKCRKLLAIICGLRCNEQVLQTLWPFSPSGTWARAVTVEWIDERSSCSRKHRSSWANLKGLTCVNVLLILVASCRIVENLFVCLITILLRIRIEWIWKYGK